LGEQGAEGGKKKSGQVRLKLSTVTGGLNNPGRIH